MQCNIRQVNFSFYHNLSLTLLRAQNVRFSSLSSRTLLPCSIQVFLCFSQDGNGEVNEPGIQFYSDLIDELLANSAFARNTNLFQFQSVKLPFVQRGKNLNVNQLMGRQWKQRLDTKTQILRSLRSPHDAFFFVSFYLFTLFYFDENWEFKTHTSEILLCLRLYVELHWNH